MNQGRYGVAFSFLGTGTTKHYVQQAKEKVRRYKRQSQMHKTQLPYDSEFYSTFKTDILLLQYFNLHTFQRLNVLLEHC